MIERVCDELLAGEPAWLWIGYAMRNGDLYHVCGLADAFRAQHGVKAKIRLVIAPNQALGLAKLYADKFDDIRTYAPACSLEDLTAEFERRGLNTFGFNKPILLHPHRNPRVAPCVEFSNRYGLTWMDLYKSILNLDPEAEFVPPAMSDERTARARAFCEAEGIEPGRSVILFPYAQSFPVSAIDHFAHFSATVADQGWRVFTSIAGPETAVPGTAGVHIPFELLPDVVAFAGWGVAVRSGICDVLAHVKARKTFIFRSPRELSTWSVARMGLGRDASELAFDFVKQSPQEFADLAVGDFSHGSTAWPPRARLTDAFAIHGGDAATTLDFADLQRGRVRFDDFTARLADGGVRRVLNIPPGSSPFWGDLIRSVRQAIAADAPGNLYACRDDGYLDSFEAITPRALLDGDFTLADRWHSLVLSSEPLIRSLPAELDWLAPDSGCWNGEPVSLAGLTGRDLDLRGQWLAPLTIDGLQLVGRWHGLEGWGLWSDGAVCTLRFTLDRARPEGFQLRLGCFAALSQSLPGVSIDVLVNGRMVSRAELRRDLPAELMIPVGPDDSGDRRDFFVRLEIDQVRSPLDMGEGSDGRQLGLGLVSAELLPLAPTDARVASDTRTKGQTA